MTLSDRVRIPADVMARRVGDETVILDLATGTYFGLDQVGTKIWEQLAAGRSLAEACEAVLAAHQTGREEVERDTLELVEELEARRLVERA